MNNLRLRYSILSDNWGNCFSFDKFVSLDIFFLWRFIKQCFVVDECVFFMLFQIPWSSGITPNSSFSFDIGEQLT